jgi:hypothetical protein
MVNLVSLGATKLTKGWGILSPCPNYFLPDNSDSFSKFLFYVNIKKLKYKQKGI